MTSAFTAIAAAIAAIAVHANLWQADANPVRDPPSVIAASHQQAAAHRPLHAETASRPVDDSPPGRTDKGLDGSLASPTEHESRTGIDGVSLVTLKVEMMKLEYAVAYLSKMTGVPIELDPALTSPGRASRLVNIDVRDAPLMEAIDQIPDIRHHWSGERLYLEAAPTPDGTVPEPGGGG